MMRSDVSSPLRHDSQDTTTGTTITIGLIAMALIVGGVLLGVGWAMVEACPIVARELAGFV